MSDPISLDFIGATLRSIQAEQRTLRMENELIRKEMARELARLATREELLEVLRVLADRIGNFEALMETRFDQQVARFDQLSDQVARLAARPTS